MVGSEIDRSEIAEKEDFRMRCEHLIREVVTLYEREHTQHPDFPFQSVELKCFGSLSSGFATKASDMDLALISPLSPLQPDEKGSPIPRLVEKALLNAGVGARLLTRTRVPIIKLCERPPEKLYNDLVEHRAKWEQEQEGGPTDEGEHGDQTKNEQDDVAHDNHDEAEKSPVLQEAIEARPETSFEVPALDGGAPKKLYLRQPPNASLQIYYATAKRVLRMAGADDVKAGSLNTFDAIHWEIIGRVCEAFVTGLADKALREQLQTSPSLQFRSTPDGWLNRHSLAGTFALVEGQAAIRDYDEFRQIAGITQDSLAEKTIRNWMQLQRPHQNIADPFIVNKDLSLALVHLRKIYSIQVATIQQFSEETPKQYHSRLVRVASLIPAQSHSKEGDKPGMPPSLFTQALVNRYVAGVQPKDVQSLLQKDVQTASQPLQLDSVARRHKSLQLVHEFAKGLEKKKSLYHEDQVRDIKAYIALLRAPTDDALITHIPPGQTALVARIRNLQDPHSLAPNQPRQRYKDALEFPKTGAGVQCDINFSAHLALQNTILLRCYAASDPRVQPMVLFVKHWAKTRRINSGYKGTLSSYGYVLMVLHYLVNVVQPFVCPNLQQLAPPPPPGLPQPEVERMYTCKGYTVHFWNNEPEIRHLASVNQLNRNEDSIGHLLRGFFEYYAHNGFLSSGQGKGFDWGRDVLSLRTQGGLLSKQEKGWTGAKTVFENASPSKAADKKSDDVREVRLRYLFAVEDPFELDHNVARTVTHNGIVSVRDEFRRAWKIIKTSGTGEFGEELLRDAGEDQEGEKGEPETLKDVMEEIHGMKFDDE